MYDVQKLWSAVVVFNVLYSISKLRIKLKWMNVIFTNSGLFLNSLHKSGSIIRVFFFGKKCLANIVCLKLSFNFIYLSYYIYFFFLQYLGKDKQPDANVFILVLHQEISKIKKKKKKDKQEVKSNKTSPFVSQVRLFKEVKTQSDNFVLLTSLLGFFSEMTESKGSPVLGPGSSDTSAYVTVSRSIDIFIMCVHSTEKLVFLKSGHKDV